MFIKINNFLSNVKKMTVDDYTAQPRVFIADVIGVILALISGAIIAWYGKEANLGISFAGYIVSAMILGTTAYIRGNLPWVILNLAFLVIDISYFFNN